MEEQIYIIIAKALQGEADEAEQQMLDAWLQESADNRRSYAEMAAMWQEADVLIVGSHFDAEPAWEKVSNSLGIKEEIATQPQIKKGRIIAMPNWMKFSSAIAAMLVIAFLVWNPFATNTITVAATDGNMTVELKDGSRVTLRTGSTFTYPKTFASKERRVSLEGEAFFEVAHNEQQPFIIDAKAVQVKVLGTSFNVRCTETVADVAVTTGRVQVTKAQGTGDTLILTAKETGRYDNGTMTEKPATGTESFWKEGILKFNGEPLSTVVAQIAAAKNVSIQLDPTLTEAQRMQAITASFKDQPLEDMLTEVCLIAGFRWEKKENTYLIRAK